MILLDDLYIKFIDVIYKRTGLYYEPAKKYFVQKRLEKRIEELELESFKEYYQLIKFSSDQSEFNQLINDLTVNETYFFRDFPQLENFAEEVLVQYIKYKEAKKDYKLKIWSAACSTGEEPYTLSIILMEMLEEYDKWDIQILATDINTEVLATAQRGIYDSRSVRDVPEEYLGKYFTSRNGKNLINLNVRKSVVFKQLNLMESQEMRNITGYDFIFCRNCLIYFDDDSRKKVIEGMYNSLNSCGYIFLGHSESIGRISSAFNVQRIGKTIVYSKP